MLAPHAAAIDALAPNLARRLPSNSPDHDLGPSGIRRRVRVFPFRCRSAGTSVLFLPGSPDNWSLLFRERAVAHADAQPTMATAWVNRLTREFEYFAWSCLGLRGSTPQLPPMMGPAAIAITSSQSRYYQARVHLRDNLSSLARPLWVTPHISRAAWRV